MSGNGSSTRISSNSHEDDEQHRPDKEDRVAYGNGGGYTKIVKVRPIRSAGMQSSTNGTANGLMNGGDFEFSIDSLPITIASSDSSPCSSDSEEVHVLNVINSPEDYDKNRCSAPESENEDEEEVLNRDCIQHEVYMSNLFHQMNNDAGDAVANGNSSGSASSNSNDSGIENELPVPAPKAARTVQKHSAPINGPGVSNTSGSGVAGGSSGTKRRRVDKTGKGLRHFSMKVCEKVRQKNVTTYNEVADELVAEFTNPANQSYVGEQYDQKNIRRRVYDALNVLMAMNIISKERKEIKWIGLPMNSLQECINLLNERKERFSRVADRLRRLYDVIIHMIAYHQLIARNKEMERSTGELKDSCRLHIPFILVATSKDTFVDCNISQDKSEYLMLYDDKFVIVDDLELLKRMNLTLGLDRGQCTEENLAKAISYVPKVLHRFVTRLATNQMEFTIDDLKDLVNDFEKRNNHIVLPKRSSSSKSGAGQSTSATAGRTENNSTWTNIDWCDEESD